MINNAASISPDFGFRTCLGRAWGVVRHRWLVLMLAAFLRDFLSILAGGLVFGLLIDLRGWNIIIALIVGCLIWSAIQGGYLKFCLNIYNQGQVNWKDLFSCLPFTFQMFFANACLWISVMLGLVLLIVPGLILAAKFSLYGFAMIDQKLSAIKSLTASYRMLAGFTIYAVGFLLIYCIGASIFEWLALGFQSFLVISLCVLYEHIRAQEIRK